jgi:hypothetical protein
MVSITPSLVALFSGAKTLGWDTQELFKNDFEKPWESLTLPKCRAWKRKFYK